jgi:hypothetical protein
MGSSAETAHKTSSKPLGQLGRDEMNLAEFPITLLTDRVPKDQKEAVYQDDMFDERTGLTLTRKLTISAGNHGLTTAADDEVILSLIQLTKQKNNFTNRRLDFSRHELVQMLGWSVGGASYDRILLSLKRWTSVFLQYENAWRDNRTKTWTTVGFHIVDRYELVDNRTTNEQLDLLPSHIIWGEDIFESFQAGYLKPLDYDLCTGLSNSTAKRMYRFLDKRFHHKPDWTFDLKEFAHEHIGLGRHYEGPAHLKRNLQPAITELESVGFLESLSGGERFPRDGKSWKVRLIRKSSGQTLLPASAEVPETEPPPLVMELIKHGMTKATAVELVQKHPAELIERQIEYIDWLTKKKPDKIGEPGAYLVAAIKADYAPPKDFISKAERQRAEEAKRRANQKAAEARRLQQEERARDLAERQAIDVYWASLTPEQQAKLDATATAEADPTNLAMETRALKSFGQTIRRHDYIRRLLATRVSTPAE